MVLDTPRFPKAGTPAYLSLLKGDVNILKWNWVQDYQKHFKTGSFKPVMHAMLIIGRREYAWTPSLRTFDSFSLVVRHTTRCKCIQ